MSLSVQESPQKFCRKCSQFKSVDDFYQNNAYEDGKHFECKDCSKIYRQSEKRRQYARDYYKKHHVPRVRDLSKDQRVGSKNHQSHLTDENVMMIRNAYASGTRVFDLSKQFDITCATIYQIITGKTWKHLPVI